MTQDTAKAVWDLLREVREIYDDIRQRFACRDELLQVRQALEEYNALVAGAEAVRDGLLRRMAWLEGEIRLFTFRREDADAVPDLPPVYFAAAPASTSRPAEAPAPAAAAPGRAPDREVRGRLKKLVNRWAYAWRLGPDLQGRINRIADEADSPLGEALALLDWSVFEDPVQTRASAEEQLARLREWRGPLAEYRRQIRGDVEALEVRFVTAVPVWERWRARDRDERGRREWDAFVEATRAAFAAETQRLRAATDSLDAELETLKRKGPGGGGARG